MEAISVDIWHGYVHISNIRQICPRFLIPWVWTSSQLHSRKGQDVGGLALVPVPFVELHHLPVANQAYADVERLQAQ